MICTYVCVYIYIYTYIIPPPSGDGDVYKTSFRQFLDYVCICLYMSIVMCSLLIKTKHTNISSTIYVSSYQFRQRLVVVLNTNVSPESALRRIRGAPGSPHWGAESRRRQMECRVRDKPKQMESRVVVETFIACCPLPFLIPLSHSGNSARGCFPSLWPAQGGIPTIVSSDSLLTIYLSCQV